MRYKHPLSGYVGEYTWCLNCEHVYRTEDWVKNDWECPGPNCDGSPFDARCWSEIHEEREGEADYPAVPNAGGYYPLYEPVAGSTVGKPFDWDAWKMQRDLYLGWPTGFRPRSAGSQ